MSDQETDGNATITLFGSLKTQGNKHSRKQKKSYPGPNSGPFNLHLTLPTKARVHPLHCLLGELLRVVSPTGPLWSC